MTDGLPAQVTGEGQTIESVESPGVIEFQAPGSGRNDGLPGQGEEGGPGSLTESAQPVPGFVPPGNTAAHLGIAAELEIEDHEGEIPIAEQEIGGLERVIDAMPAPDPQQVPTEGGGGDGRIAERAGIETVCTIHQGEGITMLGDRGGLDEPGDEDAGSATAPPTDDLSKGTGRQASAAVESVEQRKPQWELRIWSARRGGSCRCRCG